MKKLYSIVLMAAALLIGTNMRAVEVADLAGLQGALATGGDITLTADINAGSTALTVGQGITLNGNGHCVKSTNTYVFIVTTADEVVMENLVIWAAKTSKAGRGIRLGNEGASVNNANLTLNNVTINATYRAMDVWYSEGVTLNINNSTFQNVQGQTVDAKGNPTSANYDIELTGTNAGDTRGVNFGQLTNSTITITNSTMQGFFYVLNNITGSNGDMTGTKLTATNSTFKGRAALNVWGFGGDYTFTDCQVTGINNYGGSQEGFSCFVFNEQSTCHDNTLTINGGTVVSAVFNAEGGSNPNANQYMIDDRATNNTIVINNSSYSCTKDLGNDKGGIIYQVQPTSDITINGGNYDCPNIVSHTYSDGGNTGSLVITGGDFNVNTISPDMTDGNMYSTVDIQGGTFVVPDPETDGVVDIATLKDPNNENNKLISSTVETTTNQNGTVSVVPTGTKDNTSSAVAKEIEWNDANDWTVPTAISNVVIAANQTVTLEGAAGAAYRIDMGDGAKLIVKNGTTLTIGKGGVSLYNGGTAKPQIVIEQGAKVITYGLMYNSVAENLIIKASAAGYGQLLIDPQAQAHGDNHPNGTVEFVSKSWYTDGENYQWERFGIPTWTTLESIESDVPGLYTNIQVFENHGWVDLGYLQTGVDFTNIEYLNTPFKLYNLLAYKGTPGAVYTFKGELVGNSDAELNANVEWNYFPNSYLADVDGAALLASLASATNLDQTIYRAEYAGNGHYIWDAIDNTWVTEEKIAPMNAFVLHNSGAVVENHTLSYEDAVWTPATSTPNAAPRRIAASDNTAKVRVIVANEEGVWDNVKMTESATNNHNAVKYMNDDVNIYAMADEKEAIVAAENLENTYVGFSTVKGGKFTISFANVEGRELTLVDHETGAQVAIAEGNTYEFTAAANSANDYRFEIVEPAKLPTAIENAEAVKSAKGIYTITGQYVGEMSVWNTLPAGIYVVNGEKLVK